jgi:ribosomal protein S24E
MDFKLITEIENPLFNRKEIEGEFYSDSAPSREKIVSVLSEKFSAPVGAIKIRTIKSKFGQRVFIIVANIYKSKEDKDKTELTKKKDIELEKKQAEAQKSKKEVEEKSGELTEEKIEDIEKGKIDVSEK